MEIESYSVEDLVQYVKSIFEFTPSASNSIEKLEKIKVILTKANTLITSDINNERLQVFKAQTNSGSSSTIDLSSNEVSTNAAVTVVATFPDSSFLEPRGKFNVSFYNHGFSLEGKSINVFIPWKDISHVIRIPSSTSTKKEGEDILVIRLSKPVQVNGKDTRHVLWTLSNAASKIDLSIESEKVTNLITQFYDKKIIGVNKGIFQTVLNQKSFLRCYKGIQEGALYPLKCGLVFIKPLAFIPSEEIASIGAGRGGTAGTKYVDLKVETVDDVSYEFTNIEREELPSLQNYIKGYLEVKARAAMEAAATSSVDRSRASVSSGAVIDIDGSTAVATSGGGGVKKQSVSAVGAGGVGLMDQLFGSDEDSDDEDDEDFDPDDSSSDDGDDNNDNDDDDDEDDDDDDDDEDNNHKKFKPSMAKKVVSKPDIKVKPSTHSAAIVKSEVINLSGSTGPSAVKKMVARKSHSSYSFNGPSANTTCSSSAPISLVDIAENKTSIKREPMTNSAVTLIDDTVISVSSNTTISKSHGLSSSNTGTSNSNNVENENPQKRVKVGGLMGGQDDFDVIHVPSSPTPAVVHVLE